MGRTGHWFGYEASGVKPDAFSLAKGLGSGYPIGAVVSAPKLADVFQPGKHGSTFGGTPLACAAALATIEVIEDEKLVTRARDAGEKLLNGLQAFVGKYPRVQLARGMGLMLGLVLDQLAKPLTARLMEKGLLTLATAEKVVRMLPPLNVTDAEIDEALAIIDQGLAEWHQAPNA
jgi:acetylornithine aminotransferase